MSTAGPGISKVDNIEAQEKYLLHSPVQIETVLQDLARKTELITAYFDEGRGHILTTLVNILPKRDLLLFEPGADEAMNQRLLKVDKMLCVARHQDVTVRFSVGPIQTARYKGERVFTTPLPHSLFRLQRRDYYRVATPLAVPLRCRLTFPDGSKEELALSDISIGGLALLDPTLSFEIEPGEVLTECTLILPEGDKLSIDLRIQNIYIQNENSIHPQLKIGCAFVEPKPAAVNFIRRYVNHLQLQQRARGSK